MVVLKSKFKMQRAKLQLKIQKLMKAVLVLLIVLLLMFGNFWPAWLPFGVKEVHAAGALSVEACNIVLSTSQTSNTCTMTKGQTAANVVPFSSYYIPTPATTVDDYSAYVHDISISGSTVTATRGDAGGASIDLEVYLVEFDPSKVRVQKGTFSMSGTSTTSSITTAVDQSKAFLVFYYQSADTAVQQPEFNVRGYFSANNELTFVRDAGTGTTQGTWYVVEDLGGYFSVQASNITLTGVTSNTGTISSVTTAKTFLVGSYQGGSADDTSSGSAAARLTSSTVITVEKGGATGNITATVYAITFTGGENVQRGSQAFATTDTALSNSLAAGDYSNAMASSAMRLTDNGWQVSTASSDNADDKFRLTVNDGTDQIDMLRSNSGSNAANIDWEVVEWEIVTNQVTIAASADSTQPSGVNDPDTDVLMGAFTFIADTSTATVTSIKINEEGTVNANTNLSDLKLYNKTEATCQTSIPGDATEFNASAGTFDASDESTVTGSMSVGLSQVCVYVRIDVGSGVSGGESIEIEITASSDVSITDGSPTAASWPVQLVSTTYVKASSGTVCSTAITFSDFPGSPTAWNELFWTETEGSGESVTMQIASNSDCSSLIPDAAFSGCDFSNQPTENDSNSEGFAVSPVDISCLDEGTYGVIYLKTTLQASGVGSPTLDDWGVSVPENPWLLFGLTPFLLGLIRKFRKKMGFRA